MDTTIIKNIHVLLLIVKNALTQIWRKPCRLVPFNFSFLVLGHGLFWGLFLSSSPYTPPDLNFPNKQLFLLSLASTSYIHVHVFLYFSVCHLVSTLFPCCAAGFCFVVLSFWNFSSSHSPTTTINDNRHKNLIM